MFYFIANWDGVTPDFGSEFCNIQWLGSTPIQRKLRMDLYVQIRLSTHKLIGTKMVNAKESPPDPSTAQIVSYVLRGITNHYMLVSQHDRII